MARSAVKVLGGALAGFVLLVLGDMSVSLSACHFWPCDEDLRLPISVQWRLWACDLAVGVGVYLLLRRRFRLFGRGFLLGVCLAWLFLLTAILFGNMSIA